MRNVGNDGQLNTSDDDFTYTLPTGMVMTASQKFITQFNNFLPGKNFTQAALDLKLQQEADDLDRAVKADYDPINLPNLLKGYQFVTSGGDLTTNWEDVVTSGGADLYGSAQRDKDLNTLQYLLPISIPISKSAKQIALMEGINQRVNGSAKFGVGVNIDWQNNSVTFAEFVANTVGHEIGHTFGLIDAYYDNGSVMEPTIPFDIMMNGNPNHNNLTFATSHRQLLAAALGMQDNGDLPISAGLSIFRLNFDQPGNNIPLQQRDLNSSTAPEIILSNLDTEFINGDRLDFDPIAADGSGGLRQIKQISIANAGLETLNLTSLNLADGNSGFNILNRANIPTSLAIGESTQI